MKILIIEDDPVTQMLCKRLVKKTFGSRDIISAYNGQQAVEYFNGLRHSNQEETSYPELILLDLNMPVMDGWEFLRVFSRHYVTKMSNTKIIIVTSSIDPEDKRKADQYALISGFISKPLTLMQMENIKKELI